MNLLPGSFCGRSQGWGLIGEAGPGLGRAAGQVVGQAFEIIRAQLDLEDWMLERREAVAAHVATGFAQAGRGELIDADAAVEMLRQRGAERLKPRG